jgi:SAM-dependent methyltransferase
MVSVYDTEAHDIWLRVCNEREYLERYFEDHTEELFYRNPLRVLDVGCGSGASTKRLQTVAKDYGCELDVVGIDPSERQVRLFGETFPEYRAICSTLEDFETSERFDLAFVVHSLYYVGDLSASLSKLQDISDRMLIVYHGNDGINKIEEQFRNLLLSNRRSVGSYQLVLNVLENLNMDYSLDTFVSEADVSICKTDCVPGRALIDFFLDRIDLGVKDYELVRNWFKERPDMMKHEDGIILCQTAQKLCR